MTVRNLDRLFHPSSVTLIGASRRERSVGQLLARNLIAGGFEGPVWPIHREAESIEGVPAFKSVAELPGTPDLAVIATPPDSVPGLIGELAERGTKAAVVISAGFGEGGNEAGQARRQAMLEAAEPHLLRINGPNCVGVLVPGIGLNASFSHIAPQAGDVAFVTQSGAMVTSMLDWTAPRGIGFSHIVSLGDMADVDFGDVLDYLAADPETRSILLYIEAVTNARKFMSALRAAARTKRVIVIKGGRHAESAKAATSHTGALAGSDAVYDAAFRRAGALRVFSLEELFDAAETLASRRSVAGDRLAILTNGGGLGVLATDALIDKGGRLAELQPQTMAALDACLPPTWSHGNPVDIIGDADAARYDAALEALLRDRNSDAFLVMNCPVAVADSGAAAKTAAAQVAASERPVFTAWLGEAAAQEARQTFAEKHIPTYESPERAVRAFMHLVRYRRGQDMLMQTPPSLPEDGQPDREAAEAIVARVLDEGREWLSEPEAKAVLAAYGIPVVETREAADLEAAAAAADEIGYPVAVKILSPDITHKSDVGGVQLDIKDEAQLRRRAEAMREQVGELKPEARIAGFTVQKMSRRPGAHELILGMVEDAQFGPAILFGQGGTAVEVLRDKALGLPPLNLALARELMAETRVYRLLEGYRDEPAAKIEEIALCLVKLAQLAGDIAEIVEVDVNPLLADSRGVVALDARMRVRRSQHRGTERLAIRPYPRELESDATLADASKVHLRPIRPEDEPALRAAFKKLTPRDVRFRFFTVMGELSHELAARLTQIDYDREIALVATPENDAGNIWGVVRLAADPDLESAEFAVVVRSDKQNIGLGRLLMRQLIDYARRRGIGRLWGGVMRENRNMRELVAALGFEIEDDPDNGQTVKAVMALAPEARRD
jgi:acetyltransferase